MSGPGRVCPGRTRHVRAGPGGPGRSLSRVADSRRLISPTGWPTRPPRPAISRTATRFAGRGARVGHPPRPCQLWSCAPCPVYSAGPPLSGRGQRSLRFPFCVGCGVCVWGGRRRAACGGCSWSGQHIHTHIHIHIHIHIYIYIIYLSICLYLIHAGARRAHKSSRIPPLSINKSSQDLLILQPRQRVRAG